MAIVTKIVTAANIARHAAFICNANGAILCIRLGIRHRSYHSSDTNANNSFTSYKGEEEAGKMLSQDGNQQPPPLLTFTFRGYNSRLLDAFSRFAVQTASALDIQTYQGIRPFDTKYERWSILSSPHVHKTAWTQFERRTHGRQLELLGWNVELGKRLIWYLREHLPPGVRMEGKLYEYVEFPKMKVGDDKHKVHQIDQPNRDNILKHGPNKKNK